MRRSEQDLLEQAWRDANRALESAKQAFEKHTAQLVTKKEPLSFPEIFDTAMLLEAWQEKFHANTAAFDAYRPYLGRRR